MKREYSEAHRLVLERMASLLDPMPSGPNLARVGTALCHSHCLSQPTLQAGTWLESGLLGQAQPG